tara:strand:- start:2580 stop:2684 length:105 start_codon:yes stop_codon:yes gene_type:complete
MIGELIGFGIVILFVIVCCYGAGLIIYDKEKNGN